jgi:hypothetical protein
MESKDCFYVAYKVIQIKGTKGKVKLLTSHILLALSDYEEILGRGLHMLGRKRNGSRERTLGSSRRKLEGDIKPNLCGDR